MIAGPFNLFHLKQPAHLIWGTAGLAAPQNSAEGASPSVAFADGTKQM